MKEKHNSFFNFGLMHNNIVHIIKYGKQFIMAIKFRDRWLEIFYEENQRHKKIPKAIEDALYRKIQILDAAIHESDLRVPPGNRFEHLQGNFSGWCSIRVNKQYRLIFRWHDGIALDTYLDPHVY